MSKTKGHTKKQTTPKFGKNKLKPYTSDHKRGSGKFAVELGEGTGISKLGKLVTKNANRSIKKSARQQAKKDLQNEE